MNIERLIEVMATLPKGEMRDCALHMAAVAAFSRLPAERVEEAVTSARSHAVYPHLVTTAWEASLQR